jgi:hypothetical protein
MKNKTKQPEPRVRPKEPIWDFTELEAVVRQWAQAR